MGIFTDRNAKYLSKFSLISFLVTGFLSSVSGLIAAGIDDFYEGGKSTVTFFALKAIVWGGVSLIMLGNHFKYKEEERE